MIRAAPIWLTEPSRFAGWPKRRAMAVVAMALALVLLLVAAPANRPELGDAAVTNVSDLSLYEGIIDGVRAGGDYYQLAADALRAGGYPLRPFVVFRLPLHSVVQAAMPRGVAILLLYLLAAGVVTAWWARLGQTMPRTPPRLIAMLLLAGGMVACVQSDLIGFHEIWAALLLALALALRQPGRWVTAASLALIAMLVRETAVVLPIAMAMLALAEGERREAIGWVATIAVLAIVLAVHAQATSHVTGPLDPASTGWSGLLGPGFFLRALAMSSALTLLPTGLAALLAAASLLGWLSWRDPAGPRVALMLLGYGALVALFARADTFYWALIPAPLCLLGLIFLPNAARDLRTSILDRPRVRVQRITR